MKRLRFVVLSLATLCCISTTIVGQSGHKIEIKRIDAYCKSVDALIAKYKGPELVFADTAGIDDEKEKWQKFASEKALETFREKSETYTIAHNWLKNRKIVASNFTLFSASGDWTRYVYHYFREDGTLARVKSELRTFNGDFIVVRTAYFSGGSRLIQKSEYIDVKTVDLKTREPKKHGSGVMDDDPAAVDYFKNTKKLPLAHLLKKSTK